MTDNHPHASAHPGFVSQHGTTTTFTFGGKPKATIYVGIALGVILGPALCITATYMFVAGDGSGFPPTARQAITSFIIFLMGLLFGLPAYLPLIFWKKATRHMHVVFDRTTFQYWVAEQRRFSLPWNELSEISLKVQGSPRVDNLERPVLFRADRTMSSIEFHPAFPAHFQSAHPELKRFQKLSEDGVYRVHLGQGGERAQQADIFLRQYAPSLYTGYEKVRSLIFS
ncbi:hypothetical protein [Bounagaea algeriensis]